MCEECDMVDCECDYCGKTFSVTERDVVTYCPHCDEPVWVCHNCRWLNPEFDCSKCPFKRELANDGEEI